VVTLPGLIKKDCSREFEGEKKKRKKGSQGEVEAGVAVTYQRGGCRRGGLKLD